ncbi:retroelement silencing factor 1 isoform X2 [Artibeus jamaicensis]|uniref:retroelement silencing factor 1 isoform X2 n=1 Tax=Artibeus jamaicensis TaxID=9417 RepID=UPI00235A7693|nr:retroelement silencing factor 1 isoform X2 [Artibeus jamaicensis]
MNWNAKPESFTMPPLYPKNQSSFLETTLINTPSQGSLNSPGNNQPACMFLSNSNPVSQPLYNIRNYKTPQQMSVSDMHSGTIVASQSSVERISYANVKGPTQLNHSLQMSSGIAQNTWMESPMRNSMFPHAGATVSQQTGFRTNIPNVNTLQNQFVTSDTYSMQVQMIPSNSVRVPVTYQGNQRLNSSEQQGNWAQQYTASGLPYPDYRPLPRQYSYPARSFLQNPTLQKQNPMSSASLQIKNSLPPNSALNLHSKQPATVQSYQYAITQIDKRPPPPPYGYRYTSQPLQNTQHVIKHSTVDVPQSQEAHLPEIRKAFNRGFQQQNINENVSTVGNFYNLKVNTNASQPFNDPVRFSVDGVQMLAQNNQEERVDSCNVTSNQVLDTSATKERLVRDIKTLVEMKKKFSELARKVKIDKNVLMAAGCIKATNSSCESAQNSELSVKQTAKIQSGQEVTLFTPGTSEDKQPTIVETAEETNRTHSSLDTNCRNFNQVNSILINSVSSEKVPDQLHDLKVTASLKTSTVKTLSNTQFSSGNLVNVEENVQTNSETTSVPQSMAFEEYASKYVNKNRLLLNLLAPGDKTGKKLLKDSCETIQDSKPYSFEMNPNTQSTGNHLNLKTMEASSACNINAKISDSSFCFEPKSSTNGITSKSDGRCSMELLATCLSLWKKQPLEATENKQCHDLATNRTSVGISKPVEICDKSPFSVVGNSQNKIVNCSQVTAVPMIVQNYESSGATITKGTELQIAVVSPLILTDVKTLPVKGITSEVLSETVYPVIKEGSVCSLQNQLAENTRETSTLKVNEPVAGTSTNTKNWPLIQKEKQSKSTDGNSEVISNASQGKHIISELDVHYPVSDLQALSKSRSSGTMSGDLLQIGNICSLVEGDTSYNSQIAKIFNSPVEKVEPQKSSLFNLQVISSTQQKEPSENITEKKDFHFQKDNFIQCMDVSDKIPDQSKSLQPPESSLLKNVEANSETEEFNLEHITKKEITAIDTCPSAAVQQGSNTQEIDVFYNYTAQGSSRNEVLNDKTSTLYPHDQLSELLKEFPYGIEAAITSHGHVARQISDQISKDQSCDKTSCDSKDSADQIKITILNSEQMKELFPEQHDQPYTEDTLTESQKEDLVTKEGSQCAAQEPGGGESCNSVMDSEKDDVRCCALGWLAMEYEGLPQCQCNSTKNSTSKVEEGKDQCSSETNSCKQEELTSDRDVPIGFKGPPNIPPTFPDGENQFSEIEEGNNIKETFKTKNGSLRTQQELPTQPLGKGDKKLDSLHCHKRKEKLKFHEVTFHSSNKVKFSQENLQRKLTAQNSHPLKAKTGFSTNKNKDLHKKNGSLIQPILPEKKKLKASDSELKVPEKRKLGEGSILESAIKRMKYNKQEQNKNGGSIFKISNFLSNRDERVKEKIISNIKSSGCKYSSSKSNQVFSQEYLQRQKHKEMGMKTSKKTCGKNIPCDTQYTRASKVSMQVGSCGKSNERHSSVQTCKESNICISHDKSIKTHHPEGSKTNYLENVKETVVGKQPDKIRIDKTELDTNSNVNNGVELNQMSPQAKEQRKQYLNRVAFKCTERESICLTKLDGLPKKLNKEKEKRLENKPRSPLPKKDTTEKQSLLEFKLCPDGLINNKSITSTEEQKDLEPYPRKEQAPVQDDNDLGNARNAKRTFSADGFETLQSQVKDSKAMFQTYKKMYLEKRSRSLGSSPLK